MTDVRLVALGFRGFPDTEGGIETHAEQLYPRLAGYLAEVIALVRRPPFTRRGCFKGVRLVPVFAGPVLGSTTPVHTVVGVVYARLLRADVLHIHGIGPALLCPVARALGLRVVLTHHGRDYEADRWSWLARGVLRLGEWVGVRTAHEVICVSRDLQRDLEARCGVAAHYLPNGVPVPQRIEAPGEDRSVLGELGLAARRYVLLVARFTAHKRQDELIQAFARVVAAEAQAGADPDWKLVLVGEHRQDDGYSVRVRDLARRFDNVVLAGSRHGDDLHCLYREAGVFVLPSSYEGLPIAALEAFSFGVPVLLSDIPAHREFELPEAHYHRVGDVADLADGLASLMGRADDADLRRRMADIAAPYDWDDIARRTALVIVGDRS